MTALWNPVDTPLGPFTTVVANDGAMLAAGDGRARRAARRHPPSPAPCRPGARRLGSVGKVILRYHAASPGARNAALLAHEARAR